MDWFKFNDNDLLKILTSKTHLSRAFTLAEVLITLGIIGVVAAMTIPGLMTAYQKQQTEARLKQAYSVLSNAIRLSEDENGNIQLHDAGYDLDRHDVHQIFQDYIAPYLAGVTKYEGYRWDIYNAANVKLTALGFQRYGAHCLNSGMCFYMINHYTDYFYIITDLNGPSKPNRVGRDVFYFALHPKDSGLVIDGQVYAVSDKTTTDQIYEKSCNKTATDWANGKGCTEIIKRNGWKIPKDPRYPW